MSAGRAKVGVGESISLSSSAVRGRYVCGGESGEQGVKRNPCWIEVRSVEIGVPATAASGFCALGVASTVSGTSGMAAVNGLVGCSTCS